MIVKNIHLYIDPDLWREFKTACAYYDLSMKATLIKHIQNIVNDYRVQSRGMKSTKTYTHKKDKK